MPNNTKANKLLWKRKPIILTGIILGLLLLLLTIFFLTDLRKTYVIKVNDSPVYTEEFHMILKMNTIQYEQQICAREGVQEGQTLLQSLNGDKEEYQRLLWEQNISQLVSFRIKQELAQEKGIIEEFTYDKLLELLKEENKIRSEKISKGEVVYGLTEFSIEQYYSYYMSNLEKLLKDAVIKDELSVSDEDIHSYYDGLDSPAHISGEKLNYTLYDISTATDLTDKEYRELCANIRMTLRDHTYDPISQGNQVYKAQKRTFSPRELRDFSRQSYTGDELLLQLKEDEVSEPFSLGDSIYIAQYHGFHKADILEDNDNDVMRDSLYTAAFNSYIEEKRENVTIKLNESRR